MKHSDSKVREEAFAALSCYDIEEIGSYLLPPVEFLAAIFSGDLPVSGYYFLSRKIESECANMARPVFKGISIEPGAKGTVHKASIKTEDRENIKPMMDGLIKELAVEWEKGHPNRIGIAPSQLFYPYIYNHNDFEKSLSLAFRDISTSLADPIHLLEAYEAWYCFCSSHLNALFASYTIDTSEESKNAGMKSFIEENIEKYLEMGNSPSPATSSCAFAVVGAFIMAGYHLHFSPSVYLISKVTTYFSSSLVNSRTPTEVKNALLFALTDISFLPNVDESLITLLWNHCLKLSDGLESLIFLQGYCASKILYGVLNSSHQSRIRTNKYVDEYLNAFFSQKGGWNSFGAAYGFSSILQSVFVDFSDFISAETLDMIISHAYTTLASDQANKTQLECSAWVLASAYEGKYSLLQIIDLIENRFDKSKV